MAQSLPSVHSLFTVIRSFFLFADFCCHPDRPARGRPTERADGLIDHGCKKAVGKEGSKRRRARKGKGEEEDEP